MKTDEELWKQYNSQAKSGMSEEEINRAKAYAAANGQVFDSTKTQTEQDRRKARYAAAAASRTPERQTDMTDEQLWKQYNSQAKTGMSEEQINRAKAYAAANGLLFDGTVTETYKFPNEANETPEQQTDMTDEQLWAKYNSPAKAGMSAEEIARAQAYGAANKKVFDGTVTETYKFPNEANETPEPPDTKPETTPPTTPPAGNTTTEPTNKEKEELQKFPAVQQAQSGVRSIMDAYADGTIDKNTRDYLIVDSIATFAKNLGKGVQNIGAAYTGGATQDADEQSQWAQQQQTDLEQQQQMKRESIAGSPEWRKAQMEMQSLKGAELTNKINEIKSKYTDEQLRNMLKIQAQQIGMNDVAKKIADRKLSVSDTFEEMSKNSKSSLGQLGYGLLATLTLDGGQSLLNAGTSAFRAYTDLFR